MKAAVKPKPVEKPATAFRCWLHGEMLLDELVDGKAVSLSLCKECDDPVLVDDVRGLWARRGR